mmetsp:Transcript_22790/g.43510  ORF Transcript_22790/g.43510 Transcript_22790/m.43510 type:complete len:234 (+) Transcript_22790:567-1268(+)
MPRRDCFRQCRRVSKGRRSVVVVVVAVAVIPSPTGTGRRRRHGGRSAVATAVVVVRPPLASIDVVLLCSVRALLSPPRRNGSGRRRRHFLGTIPYRIRKASSRARRSVGGAVGNVVWVFAGGAGRSGVFVVGVHVCAWGVVVVIVGIVAFSNVVDVVDVVVVVVVIVVVVSLDFVVGCGGVGALLVVPGVVREMRRRVVGMDDVHCREEGSGGCADPKVVDAGIVTVVAMGAE